MQVLVYFIFSESQTMSYNVGEGKVVMISINKQERLLAEGNHLKCKERDRITVTLAFSEVSSTT